MQRFSRPVIAIVLLLSTQVALTATAGWATGPEDGGSTGFAKAFGAQRAIAVLVEYPDLKHTRTPNDIYDRIFPQLNQFYTENSYNQTWFVGHTTGVWLLAPAAASTYQISTWSSSGENIRRFIVDAIAAADPVVDFSKYDHVFLVGAQDSIWGFALRPGGLSIQTKDGVVIDHVTLQSERHGAGTYIHEMGHVFGLPDLYSYKIAGQGKPWLEAAIYVGPWEPMSRSDERPHFSSWSKLKLGWITESEIRTIGTGKISTTLIYPIELPNQITYAVRIPITQSRYYLIEVRKQVGVDKALPDQGVLILFANDSDIWNHEGPLRVIDANPETSEVWEKRNATFDIGPGEKSTFTDEANGFSVVVSWTSGDAYAVHVTVPAETSVTETTARVMRETANALAGVDENRMNTTEGKRLYRDAQSAFNEAVERFSAGRMSDAAALADKSKGLLEQALAIEREYSNALALVEEAKRAVVDAEAQGRTEGLDEARRILENAIKALSDERFDDAKKLATEAISAAGLAAGPRRSEQNVSPAIPPVLVLFVALAAMSVFAVYVVVRKKASNSATTET